MDSSHVKRRLISLVAMVTLSGCGTLANTFEKDPPNKIYVGTRASFGNVHGGILDVPFSFVLDTLLLPYTIPVTIYAYSKRPVPGEDTATSDARSGPEHAADGSAPSAGQPGH